MKLTVSDDGVCSLSDMCPELGTAVLQWRARSMDIAIMAIAINGHPVAINMHVHKLDPNNPKRDFVLYSIGDVSYRIYRDGFVVVE